LNFETALAGGLLPNYKGDHEDFRGAFLCEGATVTTGRTSIRRRSNRNLYQS
jgi:hypothetical protein